jgi:hypothetical protein
MGLFGAHKASTGTVADVAHMVERYFHNRGMQASNQELADTGGCGWWLTEGSAQVFVFLQDTPTGPVLRVTSPIVTLPAANLERFYKYMLDINADLTGCALSTHENTVLVVSQRHTKMLDQEELEELVWNVAYIADLLDDKFIQEYGAVRYVGGA